MKMTKGKRILMDNSALVLHSIIKAEIDRGNLNALLKHLSDRLPPLISSDEVHFVKMKYGTIDRLIKKIIKLDSKGVLVYSCLSISVLIHIYLCLAGIESSIIIGSCILEGKVYSHAWVETIDGHLFDYRYDTYKYRIIKKIDLLGEYR